MADTPTTRNLLRKQSLGSNLNTWGDTYLNDVLDAVDKGLSGVETITLTGNKTLSAANYAKTNEITNQTLKFAGTLAGAATVTVPSVQNTWTIVNEAGADITVKTAAGAGVIVPDGRTIRVACDGADVFNESPTNLPGFTPSMTKDIAPKDYVDQAEADAKAYTDASVAAAAIPGADGTVRVDALATPGYLGTVLTASGAVTLTDNGDTLDVRTNGSDLSAVLTASGGVTLTDNGATLDIASVVPDPPDTAAEEAALSLAMMG